jgi:hypothetical protein
MILSLEAGSSGSHYAESSLWNRLWTCRKTDNLNDEYTRCRIDTIDSPDDEHMDVRNM